MSHRDPTLLPVLWFSECGVKRETGMGAGVEQADFLNQPLHAVQCCQVTALVEKMSFLSSLLYLSHVSINSCVKYFLAPAMDPSLFSVPGMQR